jgi:hypothetical protein
MNCKIQAHFDWYSIGMGHITGGLISFGQWHKDPLVKCFVEGMFGGNKCMEDTQRICNMSNYKFAIYDL